MIPLSAKTYSNVTRRSSVIFAPPMTIGGLQSCRCWSTKTRSAPRSIHSKRFIGNNSAVGPMNRCESGWTRRRSKSRSILSREDELGPRDQEDDGEEPFDGRVLQAVASKIGPNGSADYRGNCQKNCEGGKV